MMKLREWKKRAVPPKDEFLWLMTLIVAALVLVGRIAGLI